MSNPSSGATPSANSSSPAVSKASAYAVGAIPAFKSPAVNYAAAASKSKPSPPAVNGGGAQATVASSSSPSAAAAAAIAQAAGSGNGKKPAVQAVALDAPAGAKADGTFSRPICFFGSIL